MVTVDGAGASHDLVKHLDKLAARPGFLVIWSVGWELGERERQAIAMVAEAIGETTQDQRHRLLLNHDPEHMRNDLCHERWRRPRPARPAAQVRQFGGLRNRVRKVELLPG